MANQLSFAQANIIDKVIDKHQKNWPKTISFTQTTTLFTANGVEKKTWYEAGSLPRFFRIDFDRAKGNTVIFDGSTSFRFKDHKLVKTGLNNNPLIYLLGGMYFDQIDTVKAKLNKMGIDLNISDKTIWNGKDVLVVGAKAGDTSKTQLWFDQQNLYLVRFVDRANQGNMDIHFSGQKKTGLVWHETIVDVYENGKMIQKEEYSDLKTDIKLDLRIFDPNHFGKIHWLD